MEEASLHEEARLAEVAARALAGRDVSPLLVSVNGSRVEPCTPVVARNSSNSNNSNSRQPTTRNFVCSFLNSSFSSALLFLLLFILLPTAEIWLLCAGCWRWQLCADRSLPSEGPETGCQSSTRWVWVIWQSSSCSSRQDHPCHRRNCSAEQLQEDRLRYSPGFSEEKITLT